MTNKLAEFFSTATPEEVDRAARVAGTSPVYLYHLSRQYRGTKPNVVLALGIDRATAGISTENGGRTPHVTVHDLAELCGFEEGGAT
jgi:AraC-like DNA-binding protein